MQFTSLALATLTLALAALPTGALIAWSGDHCDGPQGADVPTDGSCHSFAGRHSFNANQFGACVEFYTGGGCVGQKFTYTNQRYDCTNVNTGTEINSFRAYAGDWGCPGLGGGVSPRAAEPAATAA